jgi:hypothetical protein
LPKPRHDTYRAWAEGFAARVHGVERRDGPYIDYRGSGKEKWDNGWLFADAEIARANISRLKAQRDLGATSAHVS